MADRQVFEASAERVVHLAASRLIQLTLRCDSGDLWSRPLSFRKPGVNLLVVARGRVDLVRLEDAGGLVGVGEREEAEDADLKVSKEGRWSSAGSKVDEVDVVVVDDPGEGRQRQQDASQ